MSDQRSTTSPANGAQSHGPVTPEGKARSSRNAEKHGMYSQSIVLATESRDKFEEKRAEYHRLLAPENEVESDLVDEIVACRWRIQRVAVLEAATLDIRVDAYQLEIDKAYEMIDTTGRTALAFEKLSDTSTSVHTYRRFENALSRQYHRALAELRLLQQERRKNEKLQERT